MRRSTRDFEPILLRVEDVAKLLGIARSTAYVLIAGGELPVVRIGRATRVPREAVEQWVRARMEEARGADERVIVGPWERSA